MPPTPLPFRSLLVLGGARSGKTRYAQRLAESSGLETVLIATAEANDAEMAARIAAHMAERGPAWRVVEEPRGLFAALMREAAPGRCLVVDCATLWLANIMLAGSHLDAPVQALAACLPGLAGPVIIVSNEVGCGIVPDNAMARDFRDAQGRLNQALAAACDTVVLVNAGLPLRLKPGAEVGF